MKLHEAVHLVKSGKAKYFYIDSAYKYCLDDGVWYSCNPGCGKSVITYNDILIAIRTDDGNDWKAS